jgi:hypothetical protein
VIRVIELQLRFFSVATTNDTSESLDCFIIRANSKLQYELQRRLGPKHILLFIANIDVFRQCNMSGYIYLGIINSSRRE